MNCPVCYRNNEALFNKKGHDYHYCTYCHTCYCPEIEQSNMVGGGFELERNTMQNGERIERIKNLVNAEPIKHLDWGCGHGMLIKDCADAGIDSTGFDKFNPEYFIEQHRYGYYDIVTLVEVIEHFSKDAFPDLSIIWHTLKPNGLVYIETSFTNLFFKEKDGQYVADLVNEYYIEPTVGHSTIFSHFSLDLLMIRTGFRVVPAINQNVRLYQKP